MAYITEANGTYNFDRLDSDTDYVVWVKFRGRNSPTHTISKFDPIWPKSSTSRFEATERRVRRSDKFPALIDRLVPPPSGEPQHERVLMVDSAYAEKQVASIVKNQELSRHIL